VTPVKFLDALLTVFLDELRQTARMLFDAAVIHLSDEKSNIVVEQWQKHCEMFSDYIVGMCKHGFT
jgi:hypothetical protein